MRTGLAEMWWGMVRDRPQENEERLAATNTLANALQDEGKYPRAEAIYRELLPTHHRLHGAEHPYTLASGMNLATSLDRQGKCTDAEVIYQEVLAVQRRILGP